MSCEHWSDCGLQNGGCCALGLAGGRPSLGTCQRCTSYIPSDPKHIDRGLGDTVGRIMKLIGIEECDGCTKRKGSLNVLVPFQR